MDVRSSLCMFCVCTKLTAMPEHTVTAMAGLINSLFSFISDDSINNVYKKKTLKMFSCSLNERKV